MISLHNSLRWFTAYCFSAVLATVGVMLTAAIIGDMLAPMVGRPLVIELQMKPYYPLEIGAGLLTGYLSWFKWKGSYSLWVWVIPLVSLLLGLVEWTKSGVTVREAAGHFFSDSCWPLCDDQVKKTIPAITSAAYSLGVVINRCRSARTQTRMEPQ
jgi:hypothetical protein